MPREESVLLSVALIVVNSSIGMFFGDLLYFTAKQKSVFDRLWNGLVRLGGSEPSRAVRLERKRCAAIVENLKCDCTDVSFRGVLEWLASEIRSGK